MQGMAWAMTSHQTLLVSMWRMLTLLGAVLAIEMARRLYVLLRRQAILRRQFSGPPPNSWLLGNLPDFSGAPQRHVISLDWVKQHGPIFRIRLAWQQALCITEPALAAEVLQDRELEKVDFVYKPITEMMSDTGNSGEPALSNHPGTKWNTGNDRADHLVSALATDGDWRLFRKGLAPAFNPANIRAGFQHTSAACSELVAALKSFGPGTPVDIDQACLCETMDVIGRFGFGHNFGAVSRFGRGEMADLMRTMKEAEMEVERRLINPIRGLTAKLTRDGRAAAGAYTHYQGIMRQLLADMRQRLGASPPESNQSLGAHMLRLRQPGSGKPLPDAKLLPHIGMFFFAGHDTTGHTMSFTLYLISQHPEVEAKIVAELGAVGLLASPQNPEPRPLTHDDLAGLTFLGAAIKESMRLKPIVGGGTIRTSKQDMLLGGRYRVPAGTALWVPFHALHNSPAVWLHPDKFIPERWLQPGADYVQSAEGSNSRQNDTSNGSSPRKSRGDTDRAQLNGDAETLQPDGSAKLTQSSGTSGGKARAFELNVARSIDQNKVKRFIPFSDGRRDCIGQALAKMNYTAAVAMLLSHFHFELAQEGGAAAIEASEHLAMTLQPRNGIMMRCHPRAAASATATA